MKTNGSMNDWASSKSNERDGENEDEDVSKLMMRTGSLLGKNISLPAGNLDIKRLPDLNAADPSKAVVQSVEWHPNGELALTAGFDKKLRIFAVNGKKSIKIQSVHFPDLPIHTAKFKGLDNEIILSGRRKFFYVYDITGGNISKINNIRGRDEKSWENFEISPDGQLIALLGNDGYIVLLHGKTKQWIANLKINGSVRAMAFTSDSSKLYATGGDGEVYIWDLRSRRCLHRHVDEGSMSGTSISVSNNGNIYAVGSDSGVVNLYDAHQSMSSMNPVS